MQNCEYFNECAHKFPYAIEYEINFECMLAHAHTLNYWYTYRLRRWDLFSNCQFVHLWMRVRSVCIRTYKRAYTQCIYVYAYMIFCFHTHWLTPSFRDVNELWKYEYWRGLSAALCSGNRNSTLLKMKFLGMQR